MIRIETIISSFQEYTGNKVDCSPIQKAYILAAKAQHLPRLFSGLSLETSLEVAAVLTDLKLDIQSIVSGLLHDVYGAKGISLDSIRDLMGKDTANIVECLQQTPQESAEDVEKSYIAENMRQMIFATSRDIRILFVNLAVRLVQMRHCNSLFPKRVKELSKETLAIYSPIAERLGLSHIKVELEDLSFKYLYPKEFKRIESFCRRNDENHGHLLERLQQNIDLLLEENGIHGKIKGRIKHFYSIFRKGLKDNVDYEHIHDLIGIRIITKNIGDCYKILGLLHGKYRPVGERYKDYISYPKPNGYQSLHTMVFTNDGFGFEVQIRTEEMHAIAERGVAAHWEYKTKSKKEINDISHTDWIHDLTKSLNITSDPRESLEIFTRELYSDFVYVFTPNGKIIKLPRGASVIDFAYEIHTELGNHCSGALVNGRKSPIRTILSHGDKVEILNSDSVTPTREWLQVAVTTRALSQIRYFLRKKEQQEAEKLGEKIFLDFIAQTTQKLGEVETSDELQQFLKLHNFKDLKSYYRQLGFGKATIQELQGELAAISGSGSVDSDAVFDPEGTEKNLCAVKIAGFENLMIRYATCCTPVNGDPVVGVVNRGKGVTIHWSHCTKIRSQEYNPERLVDVEWESKSIEKLPVRLHLEFDDQIRTHFQIMKVLNQSKVILVENILRLVNSISYQDLCIKVDNLPQLERILRKINGIPSVKAHRRQD